MNVFMEGGQVISKLKNVEIQNVERQIISVS